MQLCFHRRIHSHLLLNRALDRLRRLVPAVGLHLLRFDVIDHWLLRFFRRLDLPQVRQYSRLILQRNLVPLECLLQAAVGQFGRPLLLKELID